MHMITKLDKVEKVTFAHNIFLVVEIDKQEENESVLKELAKSLIPISNIPRQVSALYNLLMLNKLNISDNDYDVLVKDVIVYTIRQMMNQMNHYAKNMQRVQIFTDGTKTNIVINSNEAYNIDNTYCINAETQTDEYSNNIFSILNDAYKMSTNGFDEITDRIGTIYTLYALYNIMYCAYVKGVKHD